MLKVGIIGFGYMGNFHYEKVSHFDDIEVTCAFDNNEAKLADAASRGLRTYDNLEDFLKECGLPCMKVMQFAFNPWEDSGYLPHNYEDNCVAYTGTHDNDTSLGWFTSFFSLLIFLLISLKKEYFLALNNYNSVISFAEENKDIFKKLFIKVNILYS